LFAARAELFKSEGVVAILRDSNRPYNLLTMSNGASGEYQPSAAPTAVIAHEDYLLLLRLLARAAVTMELEMTNSLSAGPVEVSNTVAEIRGAAHPDEVVILAAHLDSWDLASGSTDNGAGAMAVLEAARALAQLHLQPRRTIRFVLFTGEEQGEIGSERYVAAHRNELAKISAVLVNDTGTSRVVTLGLHANYQDREAVDRVLAPLAGLNLLEPKMTRTYGSDYAPFNEAGVPGFSCIGDSPEYFETQHTQIDTFDKIHKDDITQAAQVMAGWAYNTAELPEMLPR
jgi:Zn-dependent M28 family amino/carboxypeptidase